MYSYRYRQTSIRLYHPHPVEEAVCIPNYPYNMQESLGQNTDNLLPGFHWRSKAQKEPFLPFSIYSEIYTEIPDILFL